MAFRTPTFNLSVNIWRNQGTGGTYAAPDVSTIGNLSPGRRSMPPIVQPISAPFFTMELLLQKGTDIRAAWNGVASDVCEVPAGSKRFYSVRVVDDIAKGFGNEYRFALIQYLVNGIMTFTPTIPAPVPLP